MKHITLCADDYGINEPVSQGILELISKAKLSAVSCLTTAPDWLTHAKRLQIYQGKIDIGLHFNLTLGSPLTNMPRLAPTNHLPQLPKLLINSFLNQISKTEIIHELHQQLDQFVAGIGKLPDFIDGHEHIHHLPTIRDALLTVYRERLATHRPYIRIASNGLNKIWQLPQGLFKAAIITLTGAAALKQQLVKLNIPHNTSFAGIYNFKASQNYATLFPRFLQCSSDHGLIMCHPGFQTNDNSDTIYTSRWNEFQYLNSDQFQQDCLKHQVMITQLQRTEI